MWDKTEERFIKETLDKNDLRIEVNLVAKNVGVGRSSLLSKIKGLLEGEDFVVRVNHEVRPNMAKLEALRGRRQKLFP